jgi:hypothetical protein
VSAARTLLIQHGGVTPIVTSSRSEALEEDEMETPSRELEQSAQRLPSPWKVGGAAQRGSTA